MKPDSDFHRPTVYECRQRSDQLNGTIKKSALPQLTANLLRRHSDIKKAR